MSISFPPSGTSEFIVWRGPAALSIGWEGRWDERSKIEARPPLYTQEHLSEGSDEQGVATPTGVYEIRDGDGALAEIYVIKEA